MNPLERLRYIARIEGEDPIVLALEAAYVIAELANDRALLVSALRRLLDRHPGYGVIWMLASRIAGSVFPEDEAWDLVGELSSSRSGFDLGSSSPSLRVGRNGKITIEGESHKSVGVGFDSDRGISWLRSVPGAPLVIDSDLVSSQFVVIPNIAISLIEGVEHLGGSQRVTIRASDYSLVPGVIRDSLESRFSHFSTNSGMAEIFSLDRSHVISYQGNPFASSVIDRLVSWRVPQEVLRSAGPMLG